MGSHALQHLEDDLFLVPHDTIKLEGRHRGLLGLPPRNATDQVPCQEVLSAALEAGANHEASGEANGGVPPDGAGDTGVNRGWRPH